MDDPNTEINLKLPLGIVQIVLTGLAELQWKVATNAITMVSTQTSAQMQPAFSTNGGTEPLGEGEKAE